MKAKTYWKFLEDLRGDVTDEIEGIMESLPEGQVYLAKAEEGIDLEMAEPEELDTSESVFIAYSDTDMMGEERISCDYVRGIFFSGKRERHHVWVTLVDSAIDVFLSEMTLESLVILLERLQRL